MFYKNFESIIEKWDKFATNTDSIMTKINFPKEWESDRNNSPTYGLRVSLHVYVLQRQQIGYVCVNRQRD